jgi:hypothetical protein
MVEVQVKTSATHAKPSWRLGEVSLARGEREWYVMVALGESVEKRPRCFVVPRDHVAAGAWINHNAWLTSPDVPVGKRNTPMSGARAGIDVWKDYEERWDLLRERGDEVPVFLPQWMREAWLRDGISLPPDHPWWTAMPAEEMWKAEQ